MINRFLGLASLGLILIGTSGCGGQKDSQKEFQQPAASLPAPMLDHLATVETKHGRGFGIQPSGDSAIAVTGSRFQRGAQIYFDHHPLPTTFGSDTLLSAIVEPALYANPGTIQVTVTNPDGQVSNPAVFTVQPDKLPPAEIAHLLPNTATAGGKINPQPDGSSALAIQGANFAPGAVAYFDGTPLVTVWANAATVTATIPADLLRKPKHAKITVRNKDQQSSAPAVLTVQ